LEKVMTRFPEQAMGEKSSISLGALILVGYIVRFGSSARFDPLPPKKGITWRT
jgi:hypothetical protein